jgi:hypothetical protein
VIASAESQMRAQVIRQELEAAFVLYLFNNYPKGASFSSQTLADPFFEMVQFMTSYYELTPDR